MEQIGCASHTFIIYILQTIFEIVTSFAHHKNDLFLRFHAVASPTCYYIHIDVCIVKNAEIRCIKYCHAIYAPFAQCERHLTQLCKNYTF